MKDGKIDDKLTRTIMRLEAAGSPGADQVIPHFMRDIIHVTWQTQQVHTELLSLQYLLADTELKLVLELGTAEGGTAALWAMMLEADGSVISVDSKKRADRLYKGTYLDDKIIEVYGNTHEEATRDVVTKILNGNKIDFLFVDADHTHNGVEADFMDYSKFVKPGGIIAFHDSARMVRAFWDYIKTQYMSWEILHIKEPSHNGIGVIKYNPLINYKPKWR